ncbi:MAG: cell division protein FtsL [Proteobacteria bacterium]|nr:cell division protein FtsL [Pseudomonadota bacterium]
MNAPPVRIAVVGMIIAALIAVLLGAAHVARRQQVIWLGYELSRAIEDLAQKQEENRRLRLEKATLTNPERIKRLAASLGMTQPGPAQIRVIRAGPAINAEPGRTGRPGERSDPTRQSSGEVDVP